MGDRANIYFVDRDSITDDTIGIYLYTHWNGSEWPEMLRAALKADMAQRRWSDESYLLRILVDQVFKDVRDSETGGGIGTTRTRGEYPVIVVDAARRQVGFAEEGRENNRSSWQAMVSYEDFVAQERADYPKDML
jgi:hypothetical protein